MTTYGGVWMAVLAVVLGQAWGRDGRAVAGALGAQDPASGGKSPTASRGAPERYPLAKGRAEFADGAAVAHAPVVVYVDVGGYPVEIGGGTTKADGGFAVAMLTKLVTTPPPYKVEAVLWLVRERRPIVVASEVASLDADISIPTFVVARPRTVNLLILGPDKEPVARAIVNVRPELDDARFEPPEQLGSYVELIAERDGRLNVPGRGRVQLAVLPYAHPGYLTWKKNPKIEPNRLETTLDFSTLPSDGSAHVLRIPAPPTVSPTPRLEIGAKTPGSMPDGTKVCLRRASEEADGYVHRRDEALVDGLATFWGLDPGVAYSVRWVDSIGSIAESALSIRALLPNEGRYVYLPPPPEPCTLRVQILTPAGEPAPNLRVMVRTDAPAESIPLRPAVDGEVDEWAPFEHAAKCTTDSEGRVEIGGLRRSRVRIRAQASRAERVGSSPVASSDFVVAVVALTPPITEAKLVLQPRRRLAVEVRDGTRSRVEFSRPRFWTDETTRAVSEAVQADDAGRRNFLLPRVPLRVTVQVAGRELEGKVGAEEKELVIVAPELGGVRMETPGRGPEGRLRRRLRGALLTPLDGGSAIVVGGGSEASMQGLASNAAEPIWAGRYRRVFLTNAQIEAFKAKRSAEQVGASRPVATPFASTGPEAVVVIEPGKILTLDPANP